MQPNIPLWTGREVRVLREARRMSVREFANHLGVSDRMVSKWEAAGRAMRPRPLNQAALDTSLLMASADVRQRFTHIVSDDTLLTTRSSTDLPAPTQAVAVTVSGLARHPIDGKLMTLIEAGAVKPTGARQPIWLPSFFIDTTPVTIAEYQRFLNATHNPTINDHPDPEVDIVLDDVAVDPAGNEPVVNLTWGEVNAYADWAGKSIPTTTQYDRATHNQISLTLWEWSQASTTPHQYGPPSTHSAFRTATPATDLHTLLAI